MTENLKDDRKKQNKSLCKTLHKHDSNFLSNFPLVSFSNYKFQSIFSQIEL